MKILFAGTPPNAAQSLEALVKAGIDVIGVLTRTDAPVGRKKIFTPSPVAVIADAHGIPVIKSNRVDDEALDAIKALQPDLGVVVAYGSILGSKALTALPLGWVNLHYSLLPKLRGAAPVQAAIMQGLSETGISIFQLDEGMDTGEIILQVPTQIQPGENSGRLLSRLTDLGISGLLEAIPTIAAGIAKKQSQVGVVTFAPKISRADARIKWTDECRDIENLVNAMNPEPMAWTTYGGEAFRVLEARASLQSFMKSPNGYEPGTLFETDSKILVACGSGDSIELLMIQPAGKTEMTAQDWLRGQKSKGTIVFE